MRFIRILACVLLLVTFVTSATGQQPSPPDGTFAHVYFPLLTSLPPVTQANVAIVGNPGNSTYRYWLVANYTFGQAPVSHAFKLANAPTVLSGSNYVSIIPVYPLGATVDVLRTTGDTPPSGTGNYAVSTGNTSGAILDQGGALTSYTVAPINPTSYGLCLSNQVTGAATGHLLLDIGPPGDCSTLVADLSLAAGGGITGATLNGGLVQTGTTLGLLLTCSANQVEQWNGTAWVCATISGTIGGGGTVNFIPEYTPNGTTLGNSQIQDVGPGTFLQFNEQVRIGNALALPAALFVNSHATSDCTDGTYATFGDAQPTCYASRSSLTPVIYNAGILAGLYGDVGGSSAAPTTTAPLIAGLYGFGAGNGTTGPNQPFVSGTVGVGQGQGPSITTLDGVTGIAQVVALPGSNFITIMAGIDGQIQNTTIGEAEPFGAALYARSPLLTGGIVTNIYGLYIADQTVGGGNNPGPHGIFEVGTAPNQLGGNLTLASPATLTLAAMTGTGCLYESGGLILNTGASCAAGSGSVINATQYSAPYYSAAGSANAISGVAAPTTNGTYVYGYSVSANASVAPTLAQVGVGARAVVGTTSTDTILYSDNVDRVAYQPSVAVAVSLPTPTTLGNPNFATRTTNNTTGVGTLVTVTPVTLPINGNATLAIPQNFSCLDTVDASGSSWNADCSGPPQLLWFTKTGNQTYADSDRASAWLSNDASNDTYTLPTPTSTTFINGWFAWVKNGSTTNTITFAPAGATTIDGASTLPMQPHTAIKIVSDGVNFHSLDISPVGNNAQDLIFASPCGSSGTPSMRALCAGDLPNAAGGTVLGNNSTITGVPSYESAVVLGVPGTTAGSLALASATASGLFHIVVPAISATPTLTLPTATGVAALTSTANGTLSLDQVVSPLAAATFTDGNFPISFTSAQTTNTQAAMSFGEAAAATGGSGNTEVTIKTLANSTSTVLDIIQGAISTVFPTAAVGISQGANTGATNVPLLSASTTFNNASITGPAVNISVINTAAAAAGTIFQLQGGSAGTTFEMSVTLGGLAQAASGYRTGSTGEIGWSASGGTSAFDTTACRNGAGLIEFGSGSACATTGGLLLAGILIEGTKFTASGCSNSTTVGGATAGSFVSGTTGACTVTITMGNSLAAPNAWACYASDQTTPANIYDQKTGGSTTTAVLSGTTVSGDVISFGCHGY